MRACSGTWIAHGSGSDDGGQGRRQARRVVPPGRTGVRLRRVWLSKEEERVITTGSRTRDFGRCATWPTCARSSATGDWNRYIEVNRRFARAVFEEAKTDDPIVLVQDYHLALLPKMIREKLPHATIVTFWHIPWPNPEAFAIARGARNSSTGSWAAASSDSTRSSLQQFRRHRGSRAGGAGRSRNLHDLLWQKADGVKRYPISIESPPSESLMRKTVADCRADIRRRHDLTPTMRWA